MRRVLAVAGVASFVSIAACATHDATPTAESRAAIQGGTADGTAHPWAVGMCHGSPGSCSSICSGTLIAPNLVLTARHCVAQTPAQIDCNTANFGAQNGATSGYWYTTYNSVFQNGTGWHQAKQIITPAATSVCGNDIALVILTSNVSANEAVPVTPLVWDTMSNHKKYSTTLTAIGFGNDGASGSGVRRIKQYINLQCIPNDGAKPCPMGVVPEEFVSGDGVCPGDSGSGGIEQFSFTNNAPIVFGIAVRAGMQNGTCVGSIYTRTDAWTNLIVQTAITAAQQGGYAAPAWTVQPPPPMDAGTPKDSGTPGGTKGAGEPCAQTSECLSGLSCESGATGDSVCAPACDPNAPSCPANLTCQTNANGDFCLPPPPAPEPQPDSGTPPPVQPVSGGCAVVPGSASGSASAPAFALVALGIALGRRRRR